MKAETHNLIERPYQEIVDDILTALVGGIVNEPIIYDDREDFYPLAQPARDVRGITGLYQDEENGATEPRRYTFQKGVDYLFSGPDNGNAIVWQPDAKHPADETTFYVDYYLPESNSPSPLSDINVGSVTRTLGEAIGREIATVYQQINQAYLAAFIDTAKGKSLDLVVAILGVTRLTKDYARGQVTFFRNQAANGNITIPPGVVLRTAEGVVFKTDQMRTLQRGQVRIDVPIRAADDFRGPAGEVKAGEINTLAIPIAGIDRVSNLDATFLGAEDESDDDLRNRARAALRGIGKGTLAALAQAIFATRATLGEVWEPNSPPEPGPTPRLVDPGTIKLIVESEPRRFPNVQAAVAETRAAGVRTTLVARYVYFRPQIDAQIPTGVPPDGQIKIQEAIIAALQKYVDGLKSGDPAEGKQLLAAIQKVEKVKKQGTRIVNVTTWKTDMGKSGADALVAEILAAVQAAIADDAAKLSEVISATLAEQYVDLATNLATSLGSSTSFQSRRDLVIAGLTQTTPTLAQALLTKIQQTVADDPQLVSDAIAAAVQRAMAVQGPSEQRVADRSLVQGQGGQRATLDEIAAGNFMIMPVADGENWWLVLDLVPSDIVLKEA